MHVFFAYHAADPFVGFTEDDLLKVIKPRSLKAHGTANILLLVLIEIEFLTRLNYEKQQLFKREDFMPLSLW